MSDTLHVLSECFKFKNPFSRSAFFDKLSNSLVIFQLFKAKKKSGLCQLSIYCNPIFQILLYAKKTQKLKSLGWKSVQQNKVLDRNPCESMLAVMILLFILTTFIYNM